jgi:hypothetical protein
LVYIIFILFLSTQHQFQRMSRCLDRHVSAHLCHLQVLFLVTITVS